MTKLPLLEGLLKYKNENNSYFCMPGHKSGLGFLNTDIGQEFIKNLVKVDITEVDGLDNLHNPTGIIKESEKLLSNYYGSKKSYFLVNGSTSGNLIMIFSAFKEGDKIIVERNCHKSIFNAIVLRKLNPIYIKNKINKNYNAPFSIDMEHFFKTIKENKDAKGIVITYPNYYGIACNLEKVIKEAKKYGMFVLVDSAHGAHFGVNEKLPKNAVECGCDMVVMSSHKTLPSFTQTAYLHIGNNINEEVVDFYFDCFTSTSPSYMLMASMDYARYYLETKGKQEYLKIINICNEYRKKINLIDGFHVIGMDDLTNDENLDLTRYILNLEKGYSAFKLLNYLRKNKIQCEMSDSQNVILIFSPFNTQEEFEKLYLVLKNCNLEDLKENYKQVIINNIPKMMLKPFEVNNYEKVYVYFKDALNKVSAKAVVPYPPGIPIVMPGEIISNEVINMIEYNINNNVEILGINDNYEILILKY